MIADGYQKSTSNTYDNIIDAPSQGVSRWHLGRLRTATVVSKGPNVGEGIPTSITRSSSFEYDPGTGFLKKETVEPGSVGDVANLTLVAEYGYDEFGHKTSATTTGGGLLTARKTKTIYDAQGRFPDHTTVDPDHAVNSFDHTESYKYDPYFGVVTSLTGPNGLTTTWK